MKYAHLADLHLGSWRDEKMRDLSTKAFITAIDQCLQQNVDFILFAGDLFNTSLPALDTLKIVTKKIKELYDKNIPLYVIPGSHDFSPSGKTMIDVLENAGLLINVCKGQINEETKELQLNFVTDKKTGAKITGMLGRRGMLDRTYYENLHHSNLENEQGYKIFMFHTSITELMPIDLAMIDSQPLSSLPKGFNYYAGGHIHHPTKFNKENYKDVTYTGALFPNNFQELEKYGKGGYYIVNYENEQQEVNWVPLEIVNHNSLILDCKNKSPNDITLEVMDYYNNMDLSETLVTIRLHGKIATGKVSEINFKQIFEKLYSQKAYFVMKNTSKLYSEEFSEIKISNANPDIIEEQIIKEHLQQIKLFQEDKELQLTKSLMSCLNITKKEGEKVADYNKRVNDEINQILEMNVSI